MPRTKNNSIDLFLDSGAFSAWRQGVDVNIEEYIAFIKKHKEHLSVYANLDAIGDPVKTLKNQRTMEKAGLEPLPCFHYGEPIKYLEDYVSGYDYIALGGMVPISSKNLSIWLDDLFANHLTDKKGMPLVKVHGFGMTSLKLMLRYPWYSVDSTSWVVTGRLGSIYVPRFRKGKYIYDEDSWKVAVSTRSPAKKEAGEHIDTLTAAQHQAVLDYLDSKGFVLGSSTFSMQPGSYELAENERWASKPEKEKDEREVEHIKKYGVSNDYRLRDKINIMYFLDLEASMPEWPWAWKGSNQSSGFNI